MLDRVELIKRTDKGDELTWQEVDQNWSLLETAANYLLASNWQKDIDNVPAGQLKVTHDFGLLPKSVTVWQKVNADTWVPVATPDVSYKDAEITQTVYINFPEAPGTIKVIIKF